MLWLLFIAINGWLQVLVILEQVLVILKQAVERKQIEMEQLKYSAQAMFEPITYFGLIFLLAGLSTSVGLFVYRRVHLRKEGLREPFTDDLQGNGEICFVWDIVYK